MTDKNFNVVFKDKWDEESFDGTNETVIEVQYDKATEKPVYIELRDVIEDEINNAIGIDLTKKQAVELAYALLRINWDLEKNVTIHASTITSNDESHIKIIQPFEVVSSTLINNIGHNVQLDGYHIGIDLANEKENEK